jgi:hypothetical protein
MSSNSPTNDERRHPLPATPGGEQPAVNNGPEASTEERVAGCPDAPCSASDFLEETIERIDIGVCGLWGGPKPFRSLVLSIKGVDGVEITSLDAEKLADMCSRFLADPLGQIGTLHVTTRKVMTPVKSPPLDLHQAPSE